MTQMSYIEELQKSLDAEKVDPKSPIDMAIAASLKQAKLIEEEIFKLHRNKVKKLNFFLFFNNR